MTRGTQQYWDSIATSYQRHTRISTKNFHYGPLLAGDDEFSCLPARLDGLRCLEAGCGAGQNSMVLARRGARCVAIDSSRRQLDIGRRLSRRCRLTVDYCRCDLESLPDDGLGLFDVIHSVHALEFVDDAPAVLKALAAMLVHGGILLLATLHPLAAAEPVRVGNRRMGCLVTDYFNPEPDCRGGRGGREMCCSRALPIGELAEAVGAAGLRLERMLEPAPPPLRSMSETAIRRTVPYESRAWRARYPLLRAIPFTLIIRAVRG